MDGKELDALEPKRLMEHMRVLCKEIGPRPACSPKEAEAADYVLRTLHDLGYPDVCVQPFKSNDTMGWWTIPLVLILIFSLPLFFFAGRLGKWIAGLSCLVAAENIRGITRVRLPFFQRLVARGRSQNVYLTIAPRGAVRGRVTLIAHLDSNKQRFTLPPSNPALMKPLLTLQIVYAALMGLVMMGASGARRGSPFLMGFYAVSGGMLLSSLGLQLNDERQPFIEGASDNASGVSVLLGIAEALRTYPLEHTEVTLLFTGCEEPGCTGMEAYLRQQRPPRDTWFVDVDNVGSGGVCYVLKHGGSYLSTYLPDAGLVEIASRAAQKNAHLGVSGREMLTVDEVATVNNFGYRGLLLTSYNQQGYLNNWHRVNDQLETINPATWSRAAQFTWAMLQEVDL